MSPITTLAIILTIFVLHQNRLILAEEVVFDLNVYYFEAAPDGVKKQVLGVNGQFPAPTIRVKIDDTLIVRFTNSIKDSDGLEFPTSIHWHGIEMFLTPWYDGPEGVTQCPIPYGQSMEYRFKLIQAGTYWYHSHHSWQYTDGFWGLLIVENTPESYAYDDERSISLMDWYHTPSKILSERFHKQEILFPIPDTGLINGRGTYPCGMVKPGSGIECDPTKQSPAVIIVTKGKTYRIRVINTSAVANYNFSIDGHKLTAIEVDGVDTVQVGPVDSVVVWPAQRYSFLVTMNGELDAYWIRANMNLLASRILHPKAILLYSRESSWSAATVASRRSMIWKSGTQGRPETHGIDWEKLMKNAKDDISKALTILFGDIDSRSEYIFPLQPPLIDITRGQAEDERHKMALSTVKFPSTESNPNPTFLNPNLCRPKGSRGPSSAPDYYDYLVVLNTTIHTSNKSIEYKLNGMTYAVHSPPVIMRIMNNMQIDSSSNPQYIPKLKRVIQVVINNQDRASHPWHLHGHTFWVLGTGETGSNNYIESRDQDKLNVNGVRRDTTHALGNSWVVVRFETDNPGAWLLHCHINWHAEIGLGAVFIEGEEELRTLYKIPDEARRVCSLNGIDL